MSKTHEGIQEDDLLIEMINDVLSCEISYASTPARICYIVNLCFERDLPIEIHIHGITRKARPKPIYIPVTFRFEEEDRDLMNWAIKQTEKHVPL